MKKYNNLKGLTKAARLELLHRKNPPHDVVIDDQDGRIKLSVETDLFLWSDGAVHDRVEFDD